MADSYRPDRGISRQDSHRMHGYHVRAQGKAGLFRVFVGDAAHGGQRRALAAAKRELGRLRRRAGPRKPNPAAFGHRRRRRPR